MDSGGQRLALVLTVNFARIVFMCGLVLIPSESSVLAQQDQRGPDYTDPEQLALMAKRQRLEQDEKNILVWRVGLGEFELKAQRVRRQIEALSFVSEDEISPRLQAFASEMHKELAMLERQVETMKRSLATETQLLEEDTTRLDAEEEQLKKRMASTEGQASKSPMDEYLDRINQQTELVRREGAQRQKQLDMQNLLRIQESELSPRAPGEAPIDMPFAPVDGTYDSEELKLCQMLEKKVAEKDYDIAEINLLAAQGLPGAETLDVGKTLKTLDLWAAWVKHETDRHLYKFNKAPEEYSNSEAYFRILMMVCTLQEDFRICYNKDPKMRVGPVEVVPNDFTFFGKSQDLFVHGLTESEHQGTCASLPVLYVAIGRRLGYPLKLVECKGHLFVRWEDAKERFNIEGTNRGLNCYPDQEYMEWPWPISREELETGMYMTSLSPRRELAAFLELRSLCLKQHNREKQHSTAKLFADNLRKKEGVDLDRLNQLMRLSQGASGGGSIGPAVFYQVLTNTNSWRARENERGAPGMHAVFATDRFNSD